MSSIRPIWKFTCVTLVAIFAPRADGWSQVVNNPPVASPSSASAPGRRALLVGIDDYERPVRGSSLAPPPGRGFRNLRGAAGDARALAEVLVARFGFPREDIVVLADRAATRAAILGDFERRLVAESKPGDIVLFYFGGHGSLVPNPASDEPDKLDESLVPADAGQGAEDIRDKEVRRLLNRVIDRGALPTVILDSCHSGSAARGLPTGAEPRALRPAVRPVHDPGPYGPSPEERGALVWSATQADGLAWETDDAEGRAHGAFSWALLRSLSDAPSDETAEETFERVRARLHAELRYQEPVLEGSEAVRRSPLFGTGAVSSTPLQVVAFERIDEDGLAILEGGWADGLVPGSRLSWQSEGGALVELEVVEVLGAGRAKAKRYSSKSKQSAPTAFPPGLVSIPSGALLTVSGRPAAEGRRLKIWLPTWPGDFEPVLRFAKDLQSAAATAGISWVGDPLSEHPTHVVRWLGARWQIVPAGATPQTLEDFPTAPSLLSEVPRGARLFVQLPLPEIFARRLEVGPGTANDGIEPVSDPAEAAVLLAGRWIDSGAEFSWFRPDASNRDSLDALPPQTPWRRLESPEENELRADLYHLRKIQGWLSLTSPPEGAFAYQLALEPTVGPKLESEGVLREGVLYDVVLHLRPGFPPARVRPRHLYVFSIDSEGNSTLLFGGKSDLNRLPFGFDPPGGPASPPISIRLGDQTLVEVVKPLGRDIYFLLTTDEPLANPGILNYRGFRKRGPPGATPLEELLSLTGGTGRGKPKLAIPIAWSIERRGFVSVGN
ncbi:MAG TPA: caspase family protein [Thermoanaerobaculia bacterium]|jgi:uncharacterized caspase-like protein|nr:caspase family protein [Thermoanaerobaculia bacterium]